MGHVILPSGTTFWVDELQGSINLSHLINDMKCEDYTSQYRISIISALSKLGKNAQNALSYLKELAAVKNPGENGKLLAEAAEQAVKKIEEGGSVAGTTWQDNRYTPTRSDRSYNYNGTTTTTKKPEPQKVVFTEIEAGEELHSGLKHICRCNFCEKMTSIHGGLRKYSDRLVGESKFFCNFCIRNDYYQRHNSSIMILTYRGLIGYYYYSYFVAPKSPSMYLIDIQDYIELHIKAGLQNPLFRYDPETFNWFIDFSKVGKTKRKVPVENVLSTISEQLACFNIYENVREASPRKLYEKYKQAVMEFYQHRARTNDDKIFAPTLWGCDIPTRCSAGVRPIPVDILQSFVPSSLVDHRTTSRRYG